MNSNTKTILSKATIEAIIKRHFGARASVEKITELTEGWFNAIYVVSYTGRIGQGLIDVVLKVGVEKGKYILSYEKELMSAELKVYSLLRDTIVPVPQILVLDQSRELTDCDYFIMEKLTGDNWGHLEKDITLGNNERLIAKMAEYTAAIHQVKGTYFGYIKDDTSYHHTTWREGFSAMVHMLISDGKKDGVALPYDSVLEAFEPLWPILDEIKEPCLVNFDMWKKNIMLKSLNGEYVIDGIIDHERAFYGDPYADFISSNTLCGNVETSELFKAHYSRITGKPFTYTHNDRLRLAMYTLYLTLMMGVEVYRYNEEDTQKMLTLCKNMLTEQLEALKELMG